MNSHRFYTVTMAKLYADQGYLRKAAQVYRQLLKKEPGREDLRLALKEIEWKIDNQTHPSQKALGLLLREWVGLLKKQNALKRK